MSKVRCIICGHEPESTEGLKGCPKCGTTSVPLDSQHDREVKINQWELRLLCTWAERWAMKGGNEKDQASMSKVLRAIGDRLYKQLPDNAILFLSDEIKELKKEHPGTKTSFPTI